MDSLRRERTEITGEEKDRRHKDRKAIEANARRYGREGVHLGRVAEYSVIAAVRASSLRSCRQLTLLV
jgi:hypothetical protein